MLTGETRIAEKLERMMIMAERASSLFAAARSEHTTGPGPTMSMLALERALYCAAQDALDVTAMLLKREGWVDPLTYGDSAAALADLGIITRGQSAVLVSLAGLRNRLAHDYGTLNHYRLLSFEEHMEDFTDFARAVLVHLERRGPGRL